jgi:L-2-hydroxycarboxylate dehydrogenase (NAD+)
MELVNISDLKKITTKILITAGVPTNDVAIIWESIIYAQKRGKSTHGINRLPIYVNKIKNGFLSPKTETSIIEKSPVISIIDAKHGFGQVVGYKGMIVAMEKAEKYGLGLVGIRNSNSFGSAGFLAEMAATNKMVGIVIGNSAPAIAPWGGTNPVLGTNPLGVAFPQGYGKPPIVLDMATSVVARSKIRQAVKNKESIPHGWALDIDGKLTNDPVEALKGSLLPIGEHKGYGLALVIDIIAGIMTGSAFGGGVKPLNSQTDYSRCGHVVMAINIKSFLSYNDYLNKMDVLYDRIKNSGSENLVFLPGELSDSIYKKNKLAVELTNNEIFEINNIAKELGIDLALNPV